MNKTSKGKIIIPAGIHPWPHELRVAEILALSGHIVEFLPTKSTKTADILLDGIEYEIKSPLTSKANSLEHVLKKALRQSPNIIFDSSRMRKIKDNKIQNFLSTQFSIRTTIKNLILITKAGKIIQIKKTSKIARKKH